MRLYANQLKTNLANGLKPVYLIFGDEPLQKIESLDAIRQVGRQQGFDERVSLSVDAQFDWQELMAAFNSLSLFSSRKIIELEMDKGKAGQQGSKVLTELVKVFNPDTLLVIHGSKLDPNVSNTKWFKTLDKQGVFIPIYAIEGDNFTRWLSQRCQQAHIRLDHQSISLLAEYFAGNLLAAAQEIEKLAVSHANQVISFDYLQGVLLNQSRFNVFQLVDELLQGRIDQALSILVSLQHEGMEPTIVNWALTREVIQLFEMKTLLEAGMPQSQVMSQYKVWNTRQLLVNSALARLSQAQLQLMIDRLGTIDIKLKSAARTQPYTDFCHVCMLFGYADQMAKYQLFSE